MQLKWKISQILMLDDDRLNGRLMTFAGLSSPPTDLMHGNLGVQNELQKDTTVQHSILHAFFDDEHPLDNRPILLFYCVIPFQALFNAVNN